MASYRQGLGDRIPLLQSAVALVDRCRFGPLSVSTVQMSTMDEAGWRKYLTNDRFAKGDFYEIDQSRYDDCVMPCILKPLGLVNLSIKTLSSYWKTGEFSWITHARFKGTTSGPHQKATVDEVLACLFEPEKINPRLKYLEIEDVSGVFVPPVDTRAPYLEILHLRNIEGVNLDELKKWAPNIKHLSLDSLGAPPTASEIRDLKDLSLLVSLSLAGYKKEHPLDIKSSCSGDLPPLIELDLSGSTLGDGAADSVERCSKLLTLNLDESEIHEKSLFHKFFSLSLSFKKLSLSGVIWLSEVTWNILSNQGRSLDELDISATMIEGYNIINRANRFEALRKLNLYRCRFVTPTHLSEILESMQTLENVVYCPRHGRNLGVLGFDGRKVVKTCPDMLGKDQRWAEIKKTPEYARRKRRWDAIHDPLAFRPEVDKLMFALDSSDEGEDWE